MRVELSQWGVVAAYGFHDGYERKGIYSVADVLGCLDADVCYFHGDPINMLSQRYQVFSHSLTCVTCGIVGSFFAKERTNHKTPQRWHFNLYAFNSRGREILMTKDHIIPKSRGGASTLDNYQTMCATCNCKKGARV